jgi:WD40 repeat protein
MPRNCPRCAQVSPDEALYCWLDGAALDGPAPPAALTPVGSRPFLFPFVFISGRFCRNFDELVLACEAEWDEAWELLREGFLGSFFDAVGQPELAAAARRCAAEPDPNVGLDRLLDQIPGDARKPPRLGIRPADFNLGQILPGTDRRFDLFIKNEGMGLLTGWVVCNGTDWLAVGDAAPVAQKVFQCHDDARMTVRVIGERLRAGPPKEGQLFVGSSGGPACIVVRVETPIVPFAEGVLAGADSPKALAARAREAPAEAAVFFENGAVAAWYKANGWSWPVKGPQASGVAAVQQFFEALGLSTPPHVEIDRQTIELQGPPGAALETTVTLQGIDSRPVYAHAVSFAPWLIAGPAVLDGPTATILLRVAAVPSQPGERLAAEVHATANGQQHFIIEVGLAITAPVAALEPAPAPLPDVTPPAVAALTVESPVANAPGSLVAPPPVAPAPASPAPWMWAAAGGFLILAFVAVAWVVLLPWLGGGWSGVSVGPPAPDAPAVGAWEDAPPGAPFVGHTSPILAVGFTADGKLLAASGGVEGRDGEPVLADDNAIHQWDGESGHEIKRLRGLKGGIAAAAFSPDGHFAALVSFGADHAVHLWDLREAREVRALTGNAGAALCLAFSPDGRRVVSGGADGMVRIWEADTGEPLPPLKGHDGAVNCVTFSPLGYYVASGGGDHTVRLWDVRQGRLVRTFEGHKDIVCAAAFSPDGKYVASAGGAEYSSDRTGLTHGAHDFDVRLWEVSSVKEVRSFKGHTDPVGLVVFSPDGGRVLTAGNDGAVLLWRTADGAILRHFDGHKDLVRCGAFSPDGRRALTGGDDAALKTWELPASASDLMKQLAADDPTVRLQAVRDLAECGPEAAPAIHQLLVLLHYGDNDLRGGALRALPKIGAPTRADVGVLEDLLKDATYPAGRDYALDALAPLGPDARPDALTLYRLLMDPASGSSARVKAAKALGAIGPNTGVGEFVEQYTLLRDPDPAVSAAVADALSKLFPPDKRDLHDLEMRLRDESPPVRRYALGALTALGPDARDAGPRLADVLARDPVTELRLAALKALLAAAPLDPGSVAAFTAALADADPVVPPEALKALAAAGPDHGALPGLIQALGHKDAAVRQAAEDALKSARLDHAGVRALGDAMRRGDGALRERLLGILEAVGPDAADAVPGLCAILRDGPADLRRRVVDLVVQTGPAGKRAGPALAALLDDKDPALRFQVALALANIGAEEAKYGVRLLVSSLWVERQDDAAAVGMRDKAREALATIGAPAVKALTAAVTGDFADSPQAPNSAANAWARLTAVRTLKEMGKAARSAETLRVLNDLAKYDPAQEVKQEAREAIVVIGRP